MDIHRFKNGSSGKEQQIGTLIAGGKLIVLYFLGSHNPYIHDLGVEVLLGLDCVWNAPIPCNVATAGMTFTLPAFFETDYHRDFPDL